MARMGTLLKFNTKRVPIFWFRASYENSHLDQLLYDYRDYGLIFLV